MALLSVMGCSTAPKTDELMRVSYLIGCGEAKIDYVRGKKAIEEAFNECENRALNFDLENTGVYEK